MSVRPDAAWRRNAPPASPATWVTSPGPEQLGSAAELGDQGVGLLDGPDLHGTGQGQDPRAADQEDHLVPQTSAQVWMPLGDRRPRVHDGLLAGSHGRDDPLVIGLAHLAPEHPADGLGCRAQGRFADGFLNAVRDAAAFPAPAPGRRLTLP